MRLLIIFLGVINLSGCGGGGDPSVKVTNESSKPFFRATIDWEIAKDIEDKKLEEEYHHCKAGLCVRTYKMPANVRSILMQFGGSVIQSHPHSTSMESTPRFIGATEDKLKVYEKVSILDGCTDVSVVIVYMDKSAVGTDWLKKFHKVSIEGDKLEDKENSESIINLAELPHLSFFIRYCSGTIQSDHIQVKYN